MKDDFGLKTQVFSNLQSPDVQREIKNLCQGKSGVYLITNLKNQNRYVGSGITKKPTLNRLYIRFRNHFFNTHKPFVITNAIKKYGVHNFSWQVLEFTEISVTRARETHYIQTLKPEYNVLEFGDSTQGYRHTQSTREKMKLQYSQKRRDFIGNLNRNKKLSLETRQKIAQAAKKRTQEQKTKHQQACEVFNQAKFSKPTQVVDCETGKVLGTYPSLVAACRSWNGNYRTWKRCVKSGKQITKFKIYVNYIS